MTAPLTTLRATGLLRTFSDAGVLAPADIHVAYRLGKLGGESREPVLLAVALTVRALRLGSVCVEIDRLPDLATEAEDTGAADLPWPDPAELLTMLRDSPLVAGGPAGPLTPLTLVEAGSGCLLFLTRYHRQEQTIRTALATRERNRPLVDSDAIAAHLDVLFPGMDQDDPQRGAAMLAATEWTTIVAGGPGTGKTHTAARILALLYELHGPSLRVALAAPTGKAATRLQEAVTEQAAVLGLPTGLTATTLHRLLGWRRDNRSRFAHHEHNRLPHDVVLIDETSMVSLTLMARLVEALRPDTRLILLGDPDQLASVDAGAVLADLVARQGSAVASLRRGHRFTGVVADLADAVRRGAADEVIELLRSGAEEISWHEPDDVASADADVRAEITGTGQALINAAERDDIPAALAALRQHRVLCAHREGPYGVRHWARLALDWTSEATGRLLGSDHHYPGQPLLVTETDYDAGLSNGDTGVVIQRADGQVAVFDRGGDPLIIHPSRLSAVQTAYAMTIHRSQGSQYDAVSIVLPEETSAILTRQLLYTAITRTRRRVHVVGSEAVIRAAVDRQALRASGLAVEQ